MNEWIADLGSQIDAGNACVLVTVAGVRGSAPREIGAKMIVTEHETIGTIGGGQLEHKCTQIAFNSLTNAEGGSRLRKFTLGANCGQCCGGVVEVLFESFCAEKPDWLDVLQVYHRRREALVIATGLRDKYLITAKGNIAYPPECTVDGSVAVNAVRILTQKESAQRLKLELTGNDKEDVLLEPVVSSNLNIAVFGAGHVGAATVNTLSSLDCNIRWIDSRRSIFPEQLPDNVQAIETGQPELEVAAMPADTCYLVMTHSHPLDQAIIQQILTRDDFRYCGLIGSISKRRQFEKRLRKLGMAQERFDRLTCPIGIDGIAGKKPAEIAIAVAAELLQLSEAKSQATRADLPENVRLLRP
jgi:xanthine dehydrogenase accessory factor